MAEKKLSKGVATIMARHSAVPGTIVGEAALQKVKNTSNADPNEGVWREGDIFTVPDATLASQFVFVAPVGSSEAPAMAVDTPDEQGKVVYFSTLKKSVVEYEETPNGFESKKDENGNAIVHNPESPLRTAVRRCGRIGDIVELMAGKTYKCTKVYDGIQTSRLKREVDAAGNPNWVVVGLRKTSIPIFEEVSK